MAVPVFEVGPIDQSLVYTFVAGFLLAFLIFGIRILVLKSRNRREVKDLRSSLANRLDLEAASLNGMKSEIEDLKKKNANLKTSMHSLSGKPGRREKLQLQVYQSAIEKMSVRAPGFAPAWHIVLRECEEEAGRSLSGTIPFINRIVPAVGTGWADNAAQVQDGLTSADIAADSELSGKSRGDLRPGSQKSLIGKIFSKKG